MTILLCIILFSGNIRL